MTIALYSGMSILIAIIYWICLSTDISSFWYATLFVLPAIIAMIYEGIRQNRKIFSKVELDDEGISLKYLFKRTQKNNYSEYPYFQIGYYMHIVKPRIFVVISKKGLTPNEIVHINSVGISEDTVKISLNKRRAKMLLEVLPEWQKNKLQRALNGELEDIGIDLSKADEPEKIIKRRKNKKMGKMYKHKKK